MTREELKELLRLHALWLSGDTAGKRANLSRANLSRADLSRADLSEADLSEADLSEADLSGADLSGANLSKADLSRANLSRADLSRADLSEADLSEADLSEADLSKADLSEADLSGADLSGANLSKADLSGANLSKANLSGANLSKANLSGANLSKANLDPVKKDLIAEILKLPNEIDGLRKALVEGRIDGSTYNGACSCLAGTLATCKGSEQGEPIPACPGLTFNVSASSPRERWFLGLRPGDTPETSEVARITLTWVDEAIAIRDNIRRTVKQVA